MNYQCSKAVALVDEDPKTVPKRHFTDEEWAFVAPYLALVREDAPQRTHDLRVERIAGAVQEVTGDSVDLAYVDHGYTGEQPAQEAAEHGITLRLSSTRRPGAASCFCLEGG